MDFYATKVVVINEEGEIIMEYYVLEYDEDQCTEEL